MIVKLGADRTASLRPLASDDRERLTRAFDRLSEESRYRRFFAPIGKLEGELLDYLVDIDHHDHEAIVAIDPDSGEIVGVARYVRVEPGTSRAEAAVAVIDDWQGCGLGRALLERLVRRARQEGVRRFTALVQADNRPALEVLSELGHTERSVHDHVAELEIELPERGTGAALATVLRAAAASVLNVRPVSGRMVRQARRFWEGPTAPAHPPVTGAPIVVGADGSDGAARARECASELAQRLGAELYVVEAGEADLDEALINRAEEVDAQLLVVAEGSPDKLARRAPCSVLIVRGDPANEAAGEL